MEFKWVANQWSMFFCVCVFHTASQLLLKCGCALLINILSDSSICLFLLFSKLIVQVADRCKYLKKGRMCFRPVAVFADAKSLNSVFSNEKTHKYLLGKSIFMFCPCLHHNSNYDPSTTASEKVFARAMLPQTEMHMCPLITPPAVSTSFECEPDLLFSPHNLIFVPRCTSCLFTSSCFL